LWETWTYEDNSVESCTILTTAADDKMGKYHHRMPVFLNKTDIREWIEGNANDIPKMIQDVSTDELDIYPVSREVNSGRIDHPGLIERLNTLL
jgi:putative SOS response-associated peptidase YedK